MNFKALILAGLLLMPTAHAEVITVEGSDDYIMSEFETIDISKQWEYNAGKKGGECVVAYVLNGLHKYSYKQTYILDANSKSTRTYSGINIGNGSTTGSTTDAVPVIFDILSEVSLATTSDKKLVDEQAYETT